MKQLNRLFFLFALINLLGFSWPFSWFFSSSKLDVGSKEWLHKKMQAIRSQAENIDEKVLRLSLVAYINANKKGIANKALLTVIDYSKPSYERRLWVFDLKREKALFNTWVSHGKNSGEILPTSFSNTHGSLKSSLGVFLTDIGAYIGENGYSLRLKGLEKGINDNAYARSVVFHGAWYANPDIIRTRGQLGRSWGCPAVKTELAKPLIDTIKDKTLVVAYYPDRNWLSRSSFLVGQ